MEVGFASTNGVPEPTKVPPQLLVYHLRVVPEPPVAVRLILPPALEQKLLTSLSADVGGVGSATVTVNEQVDVLPAASVAVSTTVCEPVKLVPAAGLCVSFGLAEQLSDAVTDAA